MLGGWQRREIGGKMPFAALRGGARAPADGGASGRGAGYDQVLSGGGGLRGVGGDVHDDQAGGGMHGDTAGIDVQALRRYASAFIRLFFSLMGLFCHRNRSLLTFTGTHGSGMLMLFVRFCHMNRPLVPYE